MTASDDHTATIERPRRWRISPVWLIPALALFVGAWLLYQNFASHGPQIRLTVDTAEGIEAGKTQIKVRSVAVGHVTDVQLADDYDGAVLTAQMNPDSQRLLGDDTEFWVVKPRVGLQGVSGLNTILSGAYVQLRPPSRPSGKRDFKIRDNPPPASRDQTGMTFELVSHGDNTLSTGDPIVYLGQNVGQIQSAEFSADDRTMVYSVFVRDPYARLITATTQFWMRSGVDFHLGSEGVDVQLGSIQSMLAGGVTFGVPDDLEAGDAAADGDRFTLYETRNDATQDRYDEKLRYVVMLDDSVRGLSAGAPVEYRGLRIGTVEEVPFYRDGFDLKTFEGFKIPVLIAIEPQRPSLSWSDWTADEWRQHNEQFFERGLRATIKSSNLLTGSTFIDLTFDRNAPKYAQHRIGDYPIFPSEPSQITNIQQSISNLVDKLNGLDLTPIASRLEHTVATTNATLDELRQVSAHLNALLDEPGTQALPAQLRDTLAQLQRTLQGYQNGAPAYRKLSQSLDRLNKVLDDAAPLTRTLRDHPNSLIFGRPDGADPIPRAKP